MNWWKSTYVDVVLWFLLWPLVISQAFIADHHSGSYQQEKFDQKATFYVNVSSGRLLPKNFFGIFFEEINHAGAGGLWAELVNNRGFEAGGRHSPSVISPWGMIGNEDLISITTELNSCFQTNPVALRMDIKCDLTTCPPGGVGIYNPGYWGMNIEEGKKYRVVFYVQSSGPLDAVVSFVGQEDGTNMLAFTHVTAEAGMVQNWTRMEVELQAIGSDPYGRLQFTTSQNGTIWLDQVSAMSTDTYKGHGFRTDLMQMLLDLKPRFLRFPGGSYVEGIWLLNAFRWKETVGPWEERPGHLGDVWGYWSDDGLGYLEYLQLAEDLGAEPVWVVNSGQGFMDEVDTTLIDPFVQETLDSIEFARGSPYSPWGSYRAKLGHPQPFSLKYVAIGNENCGRKTYIGNYLKFYNALKEAYPDIQAISNCDGSIIPLNHPADLYDYHIYTTIEGMLELAHKFDSVPRANPKGPKAAVAFVSEYAVTQPTYQVRNGTFGAALAEAAFLLSLERNSDVVEMVCYAPLFANVNDRRWNPDAIFFNSSLLYGTPSYWVQTFFKQSSGAFLLSSYLKTYSQNIYATAISVTDRKDRSKNYITVKVVNYQKAMVKFTISLDEVDPNNVQLGNQYVMTSDDLDAQNSLTEPTKVTPVTSPLQAAVYGKYIDVMLQPNSFSAFVFIISY